MRGLLLDGKRKSIEPMAGRLEGADVQALRQFVSQSPWPVEAVEQRLAHKVVDLLSEAEVWIIDETSFPKAGQHSVGVARQYCGTLGKIANCQVAVSLHWSSAEASCPIWWGLYLPKEWLEDSRRAEEVRLAPGMAYRSKTELALEAVNQALSWGLPPLPVLADSAYGNDFSFRQALRERHLQYAVQVEPSTKEFHGDAYEFVRNDAMDANDWFVNQQIAPPGGNAPKTPLKWNIFGFTLGGPVYVPDHYNTDKSKTFFFFSQEWARYRQGQVITGIVPTAPMREGDFSQCDPASGNYSAYVSSQGCVLPMVNGQKVDQVSVNPNAAALLKAYVPFPNNGIDGFVSNSSVPTNFSDTMVRVEQNISDKARLFVNYTKDYWDTLVVPALWSGSSYNTTESNYQNPASSLVINLTDSLKPNLLNEFVASENNKPHDIYPETGPGSPAGSVDKPSTWTAGNLFPANAADPLLPAVSVCGGVPFSSFGVNSGNYTGANYINEPIFTVKDFC